MQPLPYVLLGERCSGTNIIEKLIECNSQYRPDYSIAGFKHFPRPIESTMIQALRDVPVVVVVRAPFSWIESLYQSPWHAAPHLKNFSLPRFIREEWYSVWDSDTYTSPESPDYMKEILLDRNPETKQRYPNLPSLRAGKLNHMLRLSRLSTCPVVVRLEDFQKDPMATAKTILQSLRCDIPQKLIIPRGYKGKKGLGVKTSFSRLLALLRSSPMSSTHDSHASLTQLDKDFVVGMLNTSIERQLNYL